MFLKQQLIRSLKFENGEIILHEDNKSAINMAESLETKRSKHIDIIYHLVRDLVARLK